MYWVSSAVKEKARPEDPKTLMSEWVRFAEVLSINTLLKAMLKSGCGATPEKLPLKS